MKKFVPIVIGVVVVAIGIFLYGRFAKTKAVNGQIQTATVEKKDFVKTVQSSGKTKSNTSVSLRFQTSGRLNWVGVKEGDTVQAYQAIASLDMRDVQKSLENELKDYMKQRNDFEQLWRVTYDNQKDPSTAPNDTIKRILEKNQWDLDKAVLDVELKHLAVEYATLVTPIGGIITHIDTPVAGVNITPAGATFEISDPSSLVFEANIDEIDVGFLTPGYSATVALDAFPDASFSGKVSFVSYTSQTSAGGATVFPVKITFDEPQLLRIGLNGDVSIETERIIDALVIPIEAIREDESGKFVYKKVGDQYPKEPITLGSQSDSEAVVTAGLSEGDHVVTKGFNNVPKPKN